MGGECSDAATDTIAFLDTGAALSIGTSFSYTGTTSISAPYASAPPSPDFQTGDSIILAQPVSTATYTAGVGTNPGTLVLSNATGTIETLRLAGNFTGKTFFVSPTTTGGASVSLLSQAAQGSGPKSKFGQLYVDRLERRIVGGFRELERHDDGDEPGGVCSGDVDAGDDSGADGIDL